VIKVFKTVESVCEIISGYDMSEDMPENGSWLNVIDPTSEEIEKLSQKLNIPPGFLADPLDINERPRIEVGKKNTLILIRIPYFDDSNNSIQFTTIPLGIVLTEGLVITVCSKDSEVIQAFIDDRVKDWSTAKRSRFGLQIFFRTALLYLDYLDRINMDTAAVEEKLQKSMKNEGLVELLNFDKSLVYFAASLRANEIMMEKLQETEMLKICPDDRGLLEDAITENRQAIEMVDIYSNVLSGITDTFASIISNNLNMVMKFLTSVTIILMLPTLLASIYGMNIKLPLQNWPHAFALTMGISVILSIVGIIVFVWRRWF